MHPIASGDHASGHRLTVLAIAGPVARPKDVIGDLLQARARVAGIGRPKAQQTARELRMGATVRLSAQAAYGGQAVIQLVIVGEIEMKDVRFGAE
jgi:hypothetical protein